MINTNHEEIIKFTHHSIPLTKYKYLTDERKFKEHYTSFVH
jgi:hypothetical protein